MPPPADLLERCARSMRDGLDGRNEAALRECEHATARAASALSAALLALPETAWGNAIVGHRAHRHRWYELLARDVDIGGYAAFLLENRWFPAFEPLLQRTLRGQVCDAGRAAIERNLADEQRPVPHAELMRRLVEAVRALAGDALPALESSASLVERTLVFYYGHYCDPWHLVGSLYATEVMAQHRVTCMGAGLERLGIDAAALEFIRIHSGCDDEHARDWIDGVIAPSVCEQPALRPRVAAGIAACLDTSARYLDHLVERTRCGPG